MLQGLLSSFVDQVGEENVLSSDVSPELVVYQYTADSDSYKISFGHEPQLLHFIFSLSGNVTLRSNSNNEIAELSGKNYFIYSNPHQEAKINMALDKDATVFAIVMTVKALHEIFGSSFGRDNDATREFMAGYKVEKFFVEKEMTPSISVIVHQIFNGIHRNSIRKIYQHGKIMEFLSILMDTPNSEKEAEAICPFVIDSVEMEKMKEARDIIIDRMVDPPSLKELSRMVGTNEFKLKVGFKSVYNNTVYGYLSDYRMEYARKLLTVDNARIKEVAAEVGYSNPSHFIAAYKKRYGITPKQHVKSLVS